MMSSSRRRRRSASRAEEPGRTPGDFGALLTFLLLAALLLTGPAVLGGARLWIELPLLGGVAVLLFVQGLRLTAHLPAGATRLADALDLTVVLFVVYTMARWLTSPTEYFSRMEALEVVGYAVTFFTCRYGLTSRKLGVALLLLLVVLGLAETAFGYYLSHYSDPTEPATQWFPFGPTETLQLHYYPRWLGTYGCPNHYASLLVMALGAALALTCFSKLAWPLRIVMAYAAGVLVVGIMYSVSRGSWISMLASILALMTFGIRNGTMRWWAPLSAGLVLIATLGFAFSRSPDVQARVAEAIQTIESGHLDSYVRIQLAEDALHIAHDHPFFGTGPGTFVFIHPRYQNSTFMYKAVLTHDDYLNCLDDYGLVGFTLAMFFVGLVTLHFFRPMRAEQRWQDRSVVATGFAAWVALLFHSALDFNLHIPANAMMLFALTGLALGRLKEQEGLRRWSTITLLPLGRWLGATVMVFAVAYGVFVVRSALSDIIYETASGQAAVVSTNGSIAAAEDALRYDAGNANAWVFLGDLYRYRATQQKKIEGRMSEGEKSLAAYNHALAANSIDDTVEAKRAMTFDVMRRYPEAFYCYRDAVTKRPYDGQFWYRLGNHFWERGMLQKAEEAYLIGEHCPHGGVDDSTAEHELRELPQMLDVPLPVPGTNPLLPEPPRAEPTVMP